MEPVVTAALIGFVGTLSSPFIAQRLRNYYITRGSKIAKDRIASIYGTWKGTARTKDLANRVLHEYPTELSFRTKGTIITINGKLFPNGETIEINGEGRFFDNRYLYFHYANSDSRIIHYGVSLLELADDGRSIRGEVLYCGLDDPISRTDISLSHADF
jgi:hypothetical protein